jgi:hypothetical protein
VETGVIKPKSSCENEELEGKKFNQVGAAGLEIVLTGGLDTETSIDNSGNRGNKTKKFLRKRGARGEKI